MKNILLLSLSALLITACASQRQQYTLSSIEGKYIPIVNTSHTDKSIDNFISEYKLELDKQMNIIVIQSTLNMVTGRPESYLTNMTADMMLDAHKYYDDIEIADIAFVNVGGIRAPIAKGDVTVGTIFSVYPFDNALAVVKLKGKYLTQIFESYAKMEGGGISHGAKLIVRNRKLESVKLNGKTIDNEKIYTIITLDYLAEGNDGMDAIVHAESIDKTGILLRDYMLHLSESMNKNGEQLKAKLDGRITVIQ